MPFTILGQSLWETADSVKRYLRDSHGLTLIRVEEELVPDVPRPTFQSRAPDQTIICVDIYEDSCFPQSAELFVARCSSKQLPVRYYTAFVEGSESADYAQQLRQARTHGVGVLSVNATGAVTVVSDALALTLADVRKLDLTRYPRSYRDRLLRSQQTYLQGDPIRGCSGIHEILEELTRETAKKLHKKGLIQAWINKAPNFEKESWYNIANAIYTAPNFPNIFPGMAPAIWADLVAKTKPRNEGNHPPSNQKQRVKRDREARTRFESARDNLADVIHALRIAKI